MMMPVNRTRPWQTIAKNQIKRGGTATAILAGLTAIAMIENAIARSRMHSRATFIRHEPDNRFLECALAADAEFIVTVNTAPGHFDRKQYQAVTVHGQANS
jgi:hypothetical protein